MRLNVSSAKWRPICLGLNVLRALRQHYVDNRLHRHVCSTKADKQRVRTMRFAACAGLSPLSVSGIKCLAGVQVEIYKYFHGFNQPYFHYLFIGLSFSNKYHGSHPTNEYGFRSLNTMV